MILLNKQQLKTFTNERSNIQRVFQSVLRSLLLLQTTLLFFSAGLISEMLSACWISLLFRYIIRPRVES